MTERVIYATRDGAETEAKRLRSLQTRDLFDFVVSPNIDWASGDRAPNGFYIGMVSCDG